MSIIIVVGLMRTGTSLIAKQLHELEVPMGSAMRFPIPGEHGQVDYEDVEFTDKCLTALKGDIKPARLRVFFNQYIRRRGDEPWGVKSPFLMPYVELFKAEAASLGKTLKVILTTRNTEATYKSIERQVGKNREIAAIQDVLSTYTVKNPDLIIDITESWTSPELVKQKLIELVRS